MHTKIIGSIAELRVAAEVLAQGYAVLFPFGEDNSYDMVAECKGLYFRIQCKAGRVLNGSIEFSTAKSFNNQKYADTDVDVFATYCQETGDIFFISKTECGKRQKTLRIQPSKNNQRAGVHFAEYYRSLQVAIDTQRKTHGSNK